MKYFVFLLVLAFTLTATSAFAAYVEKWEMDVDMTQAGAGAIAGTALTAPGGGTGTYGVDGFDYSGGIATFLDDGASSGNQGVALVNGTSLLGTGGYTLDMRLKWLQGTAGNGGCKSMAFGGPESPSSHVAQGRGLRVDQGWLHAVGGGIEASGGIDMTDFQDLRVIVQASGLWTIYRKGTNTVVLSSVSVGDTPQNAVPIQAFGFMLGSFSGSGTTLTSYALDYVRIAQGTEVLADHDYTPPTPEPGSMLALATGLIGMAGLALRRRRA